MCGIAGIFNRDSGPVSPDLLIRMARTLIHRGPDEEGYFCNSGMMGNWNIGTLGVSIRTLGDNSPQQTDNRGNGNVGFGHRRLSIIDLASGQQPLSNEDGTIWVILNGEIYNFRPLKGERGVGPR